jgi:hypothetical protein
MISTQNYPNCNKKFPQPSKEVANVKTTRKSVTNAKQQNERREGGKTKTKPPAPKKKKNSVIKYTTMVPCTRRYGVDGP